MAKPHVFSVAGKHTICMCACGPCQLCGRWRIRVLRASDGTTVPLKEAKVLQVRPRRISIDPVAPDGASLECRRCAGLPEALRAAKDLARRAKR